MRPTVSVDQAIQKLFKEKPHAVYCTRWYVMVILACLLPLLHSHGQRLVYSEDGISFYIDAKLSKSWLNSSGEQRYYWDVFITLRNDTPREVYIGRAYAIMPIQCWKIDGLTCDNGMAQGWLSGVRVQPNSIETYQSCWTSVCDYVTPGWEIGGIRFLGNPNPQPTPPPQQTPPATYPPKGYQYGNPIDRSPKKPSYEDTQQKQREEAQRRQEEQRRKEEEKRQQEENERLRRQTIFNDYFLKGIDYENEEKFGAARSQYNLALTYAQNEAERREVATRLALVERAERDKEKADMIERQRLQQEAEQARLERIRQQNVETYKSTMDQLDKNQKANEEAFNSLAPHLETLMDNERIPLKEVDNMFILGGSYTHLLTPFIKSNQTATVNEEERTASWNFTYGLLNKKGLSIFTTFDLLELKNSRFSFNGLATSGNRVDFSGSLKASAQMYSVTVGKDIHTASNRLHLFLGPSLSYFMLTDHAFNYGTGLAKEFRQDAMQENQFLYGLDVKAFLFLTEGIGITIGYGSRIPVKKPDTSLNYYPYNFSHAQAGLFFRVFSL